MWEEYFQEAILEKCKLERSKSKVSKLQHSQKDDKEEDKKKYKKDRKDKKDPQNENVCNYNILDVGCGNGRFGEFLLSKIAKETESADAENLERIEMRASLSPKYFGIDISENLLQKARQKLKKYNSSFFNFSFAEVDITDIAKLEETIARARFEDSIGGQKFDLTLIAAVFHHIPTQKIRLEILRTLAKHMRSGAILFFSLWNFMSSQRLKKKLSKPDTIHYQGEDVKLGERDYLMTWQGYEHLRYVHDFSKKEIEEFKNIESLDFVGDFFSDGKNRKLNHYLVFKTKP